MKIFRYLLLVLIITSSPCIAQNRKVRVYRAIILDKEDRSPISFALVYLQDAKLYQYSNEKGEIFLSVPEAKEQEVQVRCMGYQLFQSKRTIYPNKVDTLWLIPSTYKLQSVVVQGKFSQKESGKTSIPKTALEYLQPTGLLDVLSLTAGGLTRNPGLQRVQQVSMRETGQEENSALGTAIIVDGAPLSNDANLQGIGNHSQELVQKTTLNRGIDLRTLSVDHIEKIEVLQGIPSVRYGNLTSGAIILHTKTKRSPWEIRLQSDPFTKLIALGKGLNLSEKQNLYIGGDYTYSSKDKRNPISSYSRTTALLKYAYQNKGKRDWKISSSLRYTRTIDQRKFDPEIMSVKETYKNKFQQVVGNVRFSCLFDSPWIYSIQGITSLDITMDLVEQERYVTPRGVLAMPIRTTEGVGEGVFLPASYFTEFQTEGRPMNAFAQVYSLHKWFKRQMRGDLMLGLDWRWNKNFGRGVLYDPKRPPHPSSSLSSRPVCYKNIPATSPLSLFAEHTFHLSWGKQWAFLCRTGARITSDLNLLGSNYDLRKKWNFEPRIYATLFFPQIELAGAPLSISLSTGWGQHIKLPTLAYLYPEKAYFDLVEFNYAPTEEENRMIYIRTYVRDRFNLHLQTNKEQKFEIATSLSYRGGTLMFSLFQHETRRGYDYRVRTLYTPYEKYKLPHPLPEGKPILANLEKVKRDYISFYGLPDNSVWVKKRGIEYSLRLPRISQIYTAFTLQGAYYYTIYGASLPSAHRPTIQIEGRINPYIGYYQGIQDRKHSQLHTLLRADTQIPKLKLLFSITSEIIWWQTSQRGAFSPSPIYYYDEKGIQHKPSEINKKDLEQKQLFLMDDPVLFKMERRPLTASLNLKATKEVSSQVRVSFFVNNLLSINPIYETSYKKKVQVWSTPFFGIEMRIKI